MYKITVECLGITPEIGPQVAADVEREFRDHRPWQTRPLCTYVDGKLALTATNDFDSEGKALLDELSDCVVAYAGEHGEMRVLSIEKI